MKFTFVLYDEMTALDLVGPYQVFSSVPGADVRLAATTPGPKRTDAGMSIVAEHRLADCFDSDFIVVPGTSRPRVPSSNAALIGWLAEAAPRARWLCSVCTGSLVLGAAGLLRGRRATTHWLALDALREFGAQPQAARVVFDEPLVTAAGVSAGIDMALSVVARAFQPELAQIIQLAMEYDPEPPYDTGSVRSAPPAIVEAATRALREVS